MLAAQLACHRGGACSEACLLMLQELLAAKATIVALQKEQAVEARRVRRLPSFAAYLHTRSASSSICMLWYMPLCHAVHADRNPLSAADAAVLEKPEGTCEDGAHSCCRHEG